MLDSFKAQAAYKGTRERIYSNIYLFWNHAYKNACPCRAAIIWSIVLIANPRPSGLNKAF